MPNRGQAVCTAHARALPQRYYGQRWLLIWLVLAALSAPRPLHAEATAPVFMTDVNSTIGVATTRQISRAIERSQNEHAILLIVQLDTPGGLVSATRDIIKEIIASPVPIVVYVAPSGARAASAGTFIAYAANITAMAPGTNLGAATPIELGGIPGLPRFNEKPDSEKQKEKSAETAAQRKAVNDVVALIRSLAQLRSRNAEWAEKAVRDAATLTAAEALKEGVIDIVASNVDDLLAQLDGKTVTVGGQPHTLVTKNATVHPIEPDWRTRALAVISNPNIAFILLLIGFYGIILEFWSPATFIPGTVGGISLILALIALTALPVNYGALALLLLGIGLMIGEVFTAGTVVLGIGGIVAFVIGAIYLFEGTGTDIEIAVALPVIIGAALASALLIFGVLGAVLKVRKRAPVTGAEELIGLQGQVVAWDGNTGQIRIHGEVWSAQSAQRLQSYDTVRVTGRTGLTLTVSRL